MQLYKQRALALGAVRSQVRAYGMDPVTINAADAHAVLDDLARQVPDLVVSHWYATASQYQMGLFYKEWEQWRRQQQQQQQVSDHFQQMMNRLLPLE